MPNIDWNLALALIGAIFVLAGFVKGVVGLGLPTISMGLLSLSLPPAQAAALLVMPSLITNVWQIGTRPGLTALLRRLAGMQLGVCLGIALGAGWLADTTSGNGRWAELGLGLALVAYALLGLSAVRWHVPPAQESWLGPLIGLATGLVTAATGVFVMPAVPYLQALGLDKEDLVRALGISFLVSTIALAASLAQSHALGLQMAGASMLALLPALIGMALGQALRRRVSQGAFRRLFFGGLLLLGAYLAARAVTAA